MPKQRKPPQQGRAIDRLKRLAEAARGDVRVKQPQRGVGIVGVDVQALALVGLGGKRFGRMHAFAQLGLERLVGRQCQCAGAKRVRQGKIRMLGDDGIDLGQRIGLIGVHHVENPVQVPDRCLRVA